MSSIYVAGGSPERLLIAEYNAVLRAAGWRVTYDWARGEQWFDPTSEEALEAHLRCMEGVREAALVWYVAPSKKSEGSHAELGYAVALRKRIVASGLPLMSLGRIFHRYADLALADHGRMLQLLAEGPRALSAIVPRLPHW